MITQELKLATFTQGDHTFECFVSEQKSNVKHACKFVRIVQTTIFTDEEKEMFGLDCFKATFKGYTSLNVSDFGAINEVAKKWINNWKNLK